MAEVLGGDEVDARLAGTPWRRVGNAIELDAEFADFAAAWAFATRVADAAEEANHHPDILAHGWNRVRVTLSTHSAGGVTELDTALAARIGAMLG